MESGRQSNDVEDHGVSVLDPAADEVCRRSWNKGWKQISECSRSNDTLNKTKVTRKNKAVETTVPVSSKRN